MNQQMTSSYQTSSSTVIPGGGYQTSSTVHQTKEYQYEQQYGGYQTQVKTIPAQQGYALEGQQQYSLQSGFNEFQIPIQKEHQFSQQHQQHTFNTAVQNQFQAQQQQGQYSTGSNIPIQSNQPQGHLHGPQVPQSHTQFQGSQSKPPLPQTGFSQVNQPNLQSRPAEILKQESIPGSQQAPGKPFRPNLPQAEDIVEWPPKNEGGPNLTTVYPSGFRLKEEAPMEHRTDAQVVPAQPAFKITQPMKMRGDDKWPPRRGGGEEDITQEEVREFIKPKKSNRDYTEFFAQNALPNSYPGYRAPPGTQHRGETE